MNLNINTNLAEVSRRFSGLEKQVNFAASKALNDTAQKKVVQALADFAKRCGVHVHLVAHPRKGRDESERPGKLDIAGSSKLSDGADNVLSVWSAKHDPQAAEYDAEEPDGFVSLHKQRNGDVQERSTPVWLHYQSGQFCQSPRRATIRFVEYSGSPEVVGRCAE